MNGARGLVIAVIAALIVGFSAGLVAGIVFMRVGAPLPPPFAALRHMGPGGAHERGPAGMGPMGMGPGSRTGPRGLMARLDRELDLTPAQREHILAALRDVRAHHLALRESTHVAIERELTPAQRERWRAMEKEYRESWHGRAGRPSRGSGRSAGEGPPHEE